ncbi:MAG: ThuA domain-containing protein [Phycisphaerae bacterium]|nr:ThuA domain-containing protein [Phycisphaerae bacterium]
MIRSRGIAALLLVSFCLSTALWAQSPKELRKLKDEEIAKIKAAMPDKAVAKPAQPRKMLIFWRCETFFHTVIPVANEALKIMGEKTGAFQVTAVTDDYSVFTAETLKQFDIVCLNNTTSLKFDPKTTPERCAALMDFVKSGKGLVGIHAAADNFYQWPEGQEMMGNKFSGHPWTAGGTWAFKIDVPDHPLMAPFKGQGFKLSDEIYRTAAPLYSRDKQLVLMSLDTSDPTTRNVKEWKAGDEDTGMTWVKDVGKGRLFYCSFGHNDAIFMNPVLLEHYLRGIQFAAGDFPVPTKPTAAVKESSVEQAKGSGMEQQLAKVKTYDFGDSRAALTELSDAIRKAYGKPDELKKYEAALDDVLKSEAKYAGKQYACRELSLIGTDQSVPVLAGLLTNQEYSDMARYALERIPGEATDKALCAALAKADGNAKIGIVNSLGERGCTAATAAIAKCAEGSDKVLCGAAISALGKISGPEAVKALDKAVLSAPDNQKTLVYDALLKAAEKMMSKGDRPGAMKIYTGLNKEGVPAQVRSAALQGIVKASRGGAK